MQLFGPSGVRNFPIDRSPTRVNNGQGATDNGGGTSGDRGAYTVPINRRAIVSAHIDGVVTTVLAAGQGARVTIQVIPSGGAATIISQHIFQPAAALGVERFTDVQDLYLLSGDEVRASVAVDAGAGVVRNAGGVQGVEYDA